jgi:hypothetical protein
MLQSTVVEPIETSSTRLISRNDLLPATMRYRNRLQPVFRIRSRTIQIALGRQMWRAKCFSSQGSAGTPEAARSFVAGPKTFAITHNEPMSGSSIIQGMG